MPGRTRRNLWSIDLFLRTPTVYFRIIKSLCYRINRKKARVGLRLSRTCRPRKAIPSTLPWYHRVLTRTRGKCLSKKTKWSSKWLQPIIHISISTCRFFRIQLNSNPAKSRSEVNFPTLESDKNLLAIRLIIRGVSQGVGPEICSSSRLSKAPGVIIQHS